MADLGTVGTKSAEWRSYDVGQAGRLVYSGIVLFGGSRGGERLVGGGRDEVEFHTAGPSQRMDGPGQRVIPWPVAAGVGVTLGVYVKQAVNVSPRPRIVLRANADLGVAAAESVAASSTGWVQVSVTFTPTAAGVVEIVLENRYMSQFAQAPCYWDDFTEA